MADRAPQTYANHTRILPLYHGVVVPILILFMLYMIQHTIRHFNVALLALSVESLALVLLAVIARGMVITVQDRVIRLEMRLRLAEILPADLKARSATLAKGQLIALRFASDAELPALVGRVLGGELTTATDIKKAITDWQADHLRA